MLGNYKFNLERFGSELFHEAEERNIQWQFMKPR